MNNETQAKGNILAFNTVYAYFVPAKACRCDICLILQWPRGWLGDVIRFMEDCRSSYHSFTQVAFS